MNSITYSSDFRPPTSKPVANVILDGPSNQAEEDDDNDFIVDETKPPEADDILASTAIGGGGDDAEAAAVENPEGAGLLVAQILETKKELEDGRRSAFSPETPGHRRVQIVHMKLLFSFSLLTKFLNNES